MVGYRNFYKEDYICCGMKRVFVVLLFLVLVGGVSAMNGPIRVMTEPGNMVSVFIWTSGSGPILNSDSGVADDDGVFATKTFFSLNAPYKLNVVIRGWTDSFFEEIDGTEFDNGMDVDCMSGSCVVSASEVLVDVSNESGVVEEIVNESTDASGDGVDVSAENIPLTGKALFFKEDGSVNWVYSGGGIIVLLLFLVFVVVMFRSGRSKKVVLDDTPSGHENLQAGDEKELKDMEEKVKETGDKIQKVKDGRVRRKKIYEAKLKLAEEEKELSELEEGGNDEKVEKQEKVVEDTEDMVEKREDSD